MTQVSKFMSITTSDIPSNEVIRQRFTRSSEQLEFLQFLTCSIHAGILSKAFHILVSATSDPSFTGKPSNSRPWPQPSKPRTLVSPLLTLPHMTLARSKSPVLLLLHPQDPVGPLALPSLKINPYASRAREENRHHWEVKLPADGTMKSKIK